MSRATASLRATLAITAAFAIVSVDAFAHSRLDPRGTLKPRSDQSGIKQGPCGNFPPTTNPAMRTTLVAGQMLTVQWEETIVHPGHFRVAFSPDGVNGFDDNVLKDNIPDTGGPGVVFSDPSTYYKYQTQVKVPETPCENCAIQLIQVMTDRNPPSNYYSCADVRIVEASDDATAPTRPEGLKIKFLPATTLK